MRVLEEDGMDVIDPEGEVGEDVLDGVADGRGG